MRQIYLVIIAKTEDLEGQGSILFTYCAHIDKLCFVESGDRPLHGREVPRGGVHHAAVRAPAHHQTHRHLQLFSYLDRHGTGQAWRTKVIYLIIIISLT